MPEPRWSRIDPAELFAVVPERSDLGADLGADLGFSDRGRHAAPSSEEPLYSQLVSEWQLRGLMLPGQRDREWVELVVRPGWR